MKSVKTWVRRILRHFGLDIVHVSELERLRRDPFKVQQGLLGGQARTILDVGGHYGETALVYADHFPNATIHSFEPSPRSYEQMLKQVAPYPRIVPVQIAVGEAVGAQTFFENVLNGTNSLLAFGPGMADFYPSHATTQENYDVPVTTLDTYCREHRLDHVDLLKMDIQGGELSALRGAHELLSARRIQLIYTEVFFASHYAGDSLFHDVWRHLESYGYRLFDLFVTAHAERGPGQVLQGDAIFIA